MTARLTILLIICAAFASAQTTEVRMVTAGAAIAGQGQPGVRESQVISLSRLAPSPSGAAAPSGITYTCDPSVAAVAGCNYLNSTIAGIYAGTFTNATASIYITFANIGSGDAGQSNFLLNDVSYSAFRSALQSGLSSASDVTAFNASVPTTNPINSAYKVYLTLSGMRALGFTPSGGMSSTGGSCGGSDSLLRRHYNHEQHHSIRGTLLFP